MAHEALKKVNHRPWPIPDRPWRMKQTWKNLLFMHWPVPRTKLEPHVPDRLTIQEYDGNAWLGIVPFEMEGIAIRPLPAFPGLSAFPELNLRTYVEYNGKAGVWFLSLDATHKLAVWIARRFFNLPYYAAEMSVDKSGKRIHYESKRKDETGAKFKCGYRPTSDPYTAQEGSLEKWLTERYCLYAQSSDNELYRTEIHHLPWRLQDAEADIHTNELTDPFDVTLPRVKPELHYSRKTEVIIWTQDRLETS